ncbi:plexin domain-containing protein 2-like isoform X2 [Stegodyphus dumicola]|uniref:plexin domain-containing protein 2-like isoform X2 n=1 Tax=Stegodyphus dumicola TaxID=202533 RepID=UPI0015B2AD1C|nr:plexin domain-containing protein 2-like isoform X2 [Stegodyphus dumicola]
MAYGGSVVRPVCFLHMLFTVVLALHNVDQRQLNPSIYSYDFQDLDGSYFQNQDLSKSLYHLSKRSAALPPPKKASSADEKKYPGKSLSENFDVHVKTVATILKNSTQLSTSTVNSTTVDLSTVQTNSANDKYNLTVTESPANASSVSVLNVTSSTTSSTTSTPSSSAFPDVLPTKPSSITNTTIDHHVYYNSTLFSDEGQAMAFWVNFDELPQDKYVVHQMLSDSHRRAATVTLSFDFPFYGHPLWNITIATGGFVYMGDYMHSWLAATQYIAPLMANFDTSLSNDSMVRYFDNGTAFVIEWHQVTLQDEKKGGNFTFQATLLKNGNIIFVYDSIPISVTEIEDEAHPVKVGLSDAYVIDRIIYFIRRKTIYEYHRIDMKKEEIGNRTAIYFTALTTCLSYHDCHSCMNADVGLNCVWCESAKRCSDGLDRLRQDWLQSKCDVEKSAVNCSAIPPDSKPFVQQLTVPPFNPFTFLIDPDKFDNLETTPVSHLSVKPGSTGGEGASSSARVFQETSSMGVGSVVAILMILAILMGGMLWVGYAYRNPHTSSGQLLIRYRPSQWRFRSGEARYTAASVHM